MLRNRFSFKTVSAISAAALAVGLLGAISPAKAVVDCTNATVNTDECTVLTINTFGDVILPALVSDYKKLRPDIKLHQEIRSRCLERNWPIYTVCCWWCW